MINQSGSNFFDVVQFSRLSACVMEWGTSLPKTWPTFHMKVLTCTGMWITSGSTTQMTIPCISLLLPTLPLTVHFVQAQIIIAAHSTDKKKQKHFLLGFSHVKDLSVTVKPAVWHASVPSCRQRWLACKTMSFLSFITVWRHSGTLGPAFSRNRTASSFQQLAMSTSVSSQLVHAKLWALSIISTRRRLLAENAKSTFCIHEKNYWLAVVASVNNRPNAHSICVATALPALWAKSTGTHQHFFSLSVKRARVF